MTFDPTRIVVARSSPPIGSHSHIVAVLDYIARQTDDEFEVLDLLEYLPATWQKACYKRGFYWRPRKSPHGMRYFIGKTPRNHGFGLAAVRDAVTSSRRTA